MNWQGRRRTRFAIAAFAANRSSIQKTDKALGIMVAESLLLRADEVIE